MFRFLVIISQSANIHIFFIYQVFSRSFLLKITPHEVEKAESFVQKAIDGNAFGDWGQGKKRKKKPFFLHIS